MGRRDGGTEVCSSPPSPHILFLLQVAPMTTGPLTNSEGQGSRRGGLWGPGAQAWNWQEECRCQEVPRKTGPVSRASGAPGGSDNPLADAGGSQLDAGWPGSLGFWGWLGPMYWRGTWVGAVIRSVPMYG